MYIYKSRATDYSYYSCCCPIFQSLNFLKRHEIPELSRPHSNIKKNAAAAMRQFLRLAWESQRHNPPGRRRMNHLEVIPRTHHVVISMSLPYNMCISLFIDVYIYIPSHGKSSNCNSNALSRTDLLPLIRVATSSLYKHGIHQPQIT